MKRVMVIGVGAQGSTIAKRLNEETLIEEIICADYDEKAASEMEKTLSKAKGIKVNARNKDEIVAAAQGVELIVNGLAPDFNVNVLEAALEVGACYQDMASGPVSDVGFVEAVERAFSYDEKFKAKGLTALFNTGSAPGIANVVTREAVDQLDSCSEIEITVYDGIWSRKFIPFWWSPETAFGDMAAKPICYENGKFVRSQPFNDPRMEDFPNMDGTRRTVDHEHEEPVTMGLLSGKVLKGVKKVNFRYGGPGLDLAQDLYKMGLLSDKEIDVKGTKIVPMDIISKLTPPAPKYPDEIQAVLDEGMVSEEGAFRIRVDGEKKGTKTRIDCFINGPGLTEAFEKANITHESYLTGQAAFLFTKMFVNNKIKTKGAYPPEVLEIAERSYYLEEAAKLDITVDQNISITLK